MTLPASCFDVVSRGARDAGVEHASINVLIFRGGKIVIDYFHRGTTCAARSRYLPSLIYIYLVNKKSD